MEEVLKIISEELDYLIEERNKLEAKPRKTPKDKEEMATISDLINGLTVRLHELGVKDTAQELHDFNEERSNLDGLRRKSPKARQDIKDINDILKQLSSKLKEMSSRKDLEEYEAELETSQQKIQDYLEQINRIKAAKINPSIEQNAIEEINQLIDEENKAVSYNTRIISAYHSLTENQTKKNILEEIDRLQAENLQLTGAISDILEGHNLISEIQNNISDSTQEVAKLRQELANLDSEKRGYIEKHNFAELRHIEQEENILKKYLAKEENTLAQNQEKYSSYVSYLTNQKRIAQLNSQLSPEDRLTTINNEIENGQRILPENLQKRALTLANQTFRNHIKQSVSMDEIIEEKHEPSITIQSETKPVELESDYLDEEATDQEIKQYMDDYQKLLGDQGQSVNGRLSHIHESSTPITPSGISMDEIIEEKHEPSITIQSETKPVELEPDYLDEEATDQENKQYMDDYQKSSGNQSQSVSGRLSHTQENHTPIAPSKISMDEIIGKMNDSRIVPYGPEPDLLEETPTQESEENVENDVVPLSFSKIRDAMDKIKSRVGTTSPASNSSPNQFTNLSRDLTDASKSNQELKPTQGDAISMEDIMKGLQSPKSQEELNPRPLPREPLRETKNTESNSNPLVGEEIHQYESFSAPEITLSGELQNTVTEPIESNYMEEPKEQKINSEIVKTRNPFKNMFNLIKKHKKVVATSLLLLSVGLPMFTLTGCASKKAGKSETETSTESNSQGLKEGDIVIQGAGNQSYTYTTEDSQTETESIAQTETESIAQTEQMTEPMEVQSESPSSTQTSTETAQENTLPETTMDNTSSYVDDSLIDELTAPLEAETQAVTGTQVPIQENAEQTQEYGSIENNTSEITDELARKQALWNSGIVSKMAEDEYSAANQNWQGIKPENIKWWIDNPLRFTRDEVTGAYRIDQQDEYGNWVGMGYTDEESALNYDNITRTRGGR